MFTPCQQTMDCEIYHFNHANHVMWAHPKQDKRSADGPANMRLTDTSLSFFSKNRICGEPRACCVTVQKAKFTKRQPAHNSSLIMHRVLPQIWPVAPWIPRPPQQVNISSFISSVKDCIFGNITERSQHCSPNV